MSVLEGLLAALARLPALSTDTGEMVSSYVIVVLLGCSATALHSKLPSGVYGLSHYVPRQ